MIIRTGEGNARKLSEYHSFNQFFIETFHEIAQGTCNMYI